METKTNRALEELRVDLVWFLPEEIVDVLVRDFMGQFSKPRYKEESLGEVLTLRMHDKKEVTAELEKVRDILKRNGMQGYHKDGTTKPKNYV